MQFGTGDHKTRCDVNDLPWLQNSEMENEWWNSKHIVKYYFQVVLEDEEEEDTLFMNSWIYVDLESDEELSHTREYQSRDGYDEDVVNVTEKLGEDLKLKSTAESLPVISSTNISQTLHCISSAEDNQLEYCSPKTVQHFEDSDGLNGVNTPRSFRESKSEKDIAAETICKSASKVASSEPSAKGLCNRNDTSEQAMNMYCSEIESPAERSNSDVAKSPHFVSKSFLSVPVDCIINPDVTNTPSTDVYSLSGKRSYKLPDIHASKTFLREAVNSVINPSEVDRYSPHIYNMKKEKTFEAPHTPVSKSFLSEADKSDVDPFTKTKTKYHSETHTKPISSKNQKRSFSDDEVTIILSDDEHSDNGDIIYEGSYQSSSACTATKHKKPLADKKIKCEHQKTDWTIHTIAISDDSDTDIIVCEENTGRIVCEENTGRTH